MKWLPRNQMIPFPYWALCQDEKEFKRALKKYKISDEVEFVTKDANATTHTFDNKKDGSIMVIVCVRPSKRPLTEVYSWLVHEAVHVWQGICRHIGERHPSDEFEAYAIQFISEKLMEQYRQEKMK